MTNFRPWSVTVCSSQKGGEMGEVRDVPNAKRLASRKVSSVSRGVSGVMRV